MLATCPASSVHINAQIPVINVDINFILDFGIDKHCRKRGLALSPGIERRNTDQAVHPGFGFHESVAV